KNDYIVIINFKFYHFMMDQQIINLYDEYTHKPLSRSVFLKRLALYTGSMAAALSILPMLESNKATAANITPFDDELFIESIQYAGEQCQMQAYVARPKKASKYPTVIVIHENRGLTPHIEDVARRVAKAGYLAIAPNALAALGTLPANEDEARTMFTKLDANQTNQNFIKAFEYAKTRKDSNGKFACVGFCWGGAMANTLAVNMPDLKAAVAYYGRQPKAEDVPKIKATVQLHYASLDTRVNEGIAAYEAALIKHKINYELFMYEGVNHAFHNDTSAARYNEAAAKLSWERTLGLFKKTVG
ncbi:MAG: dienelactone hydrolase family protein, partial [Ferruginibacter sp.]